MEILSTQNLVQAGAVVIALVSVYLNYKLVSNHIQHNTESNTKLSIAINQLIEFLETKLKRK